MVDTLGDAPPREMARVRDRVMPAYIKIGPRIWIAPLKRSTRATWWQ